MSLGEVKLIRGENRQPAPLRGGVEARGRVISSAELLDKHGTLTILHQGACYQLRQTRAGKLILTK